MEWGIDLGRTVLLQLKRVDSRCFFIKAVWRWRLCRIDRYPII